MASSSSASTIRYPYSEMSAMAKMVVGGAAKGAIAEAFSFPTMVAAAAAAKSPRPLRAPPPEQVGDDVSGSSSRPSSQEEEDDIEIEHGALGEAGGGDAMDLDDDGEQTRAFPPSPAPLVPPSVIKSNPLQADALWYRPQVADSLTELALKRVSVQARASSADDYVKALVHTTLFLGASWLRAGSDTACASRAASLRQHALGQYERTKGGSGGGGGEQQQQQQQIPNAGDMQYRIWSGDASMNDARRLTGAHLNNVFLTPFPAPSATGTNGMTREAQNTDTIRFLQRLTRYAMFSDAPVRLELAPGTSLPSVPAPMMDAWSRAPLNSAEPLAVARWAMFQSNVKKYAFLEASFALGGGGDAQQKHRFAVIGAAEKPPYAPGSFHLHQAGEAAPPLPSVLPIPPKTPKKRGRPAAADKAKSGNPAPSLPIPPTATAIPMPEAQPTASPPPSPRPKKRQRRSSKQEEEKEGKADTASSLLLPPPPSTSLSTALGIRPIHSVHLPSTQPLGHFPDDYQYGRAHHLAFLPSPAFQASIVAVESILANSVLAIIAQGAGEKPDTLDLAPKILLTVLTGVINDPNKRHDYKYKGFVDLIVQPPPSAPATRETKEEMKARLLLRHFQKGTALSAVVSYLRLFVLDEEEDEDDVDAEGEPEPERKDSPIDRFDRAHLSTPEPEPMEVDDDLDYLMKRFIQPTTTSSEAPPPRPHRDRTTMPILAQTPHIKLTPIVFQRLSTLLFLLEPMVTKMNHAENWFLPFRREHQSLLWARSLPPGANREPYNLRMSLAGESAHSKAPRVAQIEPQQQTVERITRFFRLVIHNLEGATNPKTRVYDCWLMFAIVARTILGDCGLGEHPLLVDIKAYGL